MCPSHLIIRFKLSRRRFPIKATFAITINKVQLCWNLSTAACFSLGQLCVAFSRSCSFDDVAVAITEVHRQRRENDRMKKIQSFISRNVLKVSNINKYLFIKYFIVSRCKLSARPQLVRIAMTGLELEQYTLNVKGQVTCDPRCAALLSFNLNVFKYQLAANNITLNNV